MQGPHHVAKKLTRTTLPLFFASANSSPESVWHVKSGAGSPVFTRVVCASSWANAPRTSTSAITVVNTTDFIVFLSLRFIATDRQGFGKGIQGGGSSFLASEFSRRRRKIRSSPAKPIRVRIRRP